MDPDTIARLMSAAGRIDCTVDVQPRHIPLLQKKLVPVEPFSRGRLFGHMARQEPALFHSCPVPLRVAGNPREVLLDCLRNTAVADSRVGVWVGRAALRRKLAVREIAARWDRGRAILGITDLRVRGSELDRLIDTDVLQSFNVLLEGSPAMASLELLTFVVSTKDYMTDSHSDDPDGSNHCFAGSKLWFVWDTFEGMRHGLEDVERQDVYGQCAFDLDAFLELESSRWFTVSEGQTLFLPGHLTHKVHTLEHYFGVGSFYVGLPNCIQTIARWVEHDPLWTLGRSNRAGLLDEITDALIRKIDEIRRSPARVQEEWGLPEMEEAVARWHRESRASTSERVLSDPRFVRLLDALSWRAEPHVA